MEEVNGKEDGEQWTHRRSVTYRVYLVQSIFMGLEFTTIQATLLDYLTRSVKPDNISLWYDIINAIIYVCPVLFGTLVGRCMDKYRNSRLCLIMLNVALLAGSVLYMLPFSPLFPVFGRFLHGFHFIIRSILHAEVSRIFPDHEVQRKITALLAGISFGDCIGPLFNMMFVNVDVWLGRLQLSYGNASLLPLLVYSVIQILLLTFCAHNVSKEYDLKEDESKCEGNVLKGKNNFLTALKSLFSAEFVLLMIMSIHSGFGLTVFPRIIPLVVQGLSNRDSIVNVCFFGIGVFGITFSLIISKMELNSLELFANGYVSLYSFLFSTIAIQLISTNLPIALTGLLLVISVISWSFFMVTTKTFLIVTCNKLVSSSNQALGESIRMNVTIVSRLLTGLGTTFVYDNFSSVNVANVLLTLLFSITMTVKRKTLSAPAAHL